MWMWSLEVICSSHNTVRRAWPEWVTVDENNTADKISSTYRNCWNGSHLPAKLGLFRKMILWMYMQQHTQLSGAMLCFLKMTIHAPRRTGWNSFCWSVHEASWATVLIYHLKEIYQHFFSKASWLLAAIADTNFGCIRRYFLLFFLLNQYLFFPEAEHRGCRHLVTAMNSYSTPRQSAIYPYRIPQSF